ncbi:MAG: 5-(carboxyamino)imidazole ribonucleotide mutase [Candidatus Thermoplasmatota archaeon]
MALDVHIILGSKSDRAVAEHAVHMLKTLGIAYQVDIASAHRTPHRVREIVEHSEAKVFIAIAGLSAALPGMIAAHTLRPVIGVPVSGKVNLDAILSIVQMPPGVPVAAVGIDSGENAALLAAEILALSSPQIHERLTAYRKEIEEDVENAAAELKGL